MGITKFYYSKWFPRIFFKKYDGGKSSGVTGYFLIEWKILFSIGLLRFQKGSRDNYHNHAFNACTWWLKGKVEEDRRYADEISISTEYEPSIKPKITKRDNMHRVFAKETSWALTFRGPWNDIWQEYKPIEKLIINLTHGRKIV